MEKWFEKAKLGIFMHWGIYSVLGVTESWSFFSGEISYEEYMNQCSGFTAKNYDPKKWAELFRKAGARYTVLTSKHHDGVALWDTKQSDLSVVNKTPAKRDLIAPYCEAMRKNDIKVGLYFSHLDWNHPDYAAIHPKSDEWWASSKYTSPGGEDDLKKWDRFLNFHRAQLKELLTNYGDIDLLWFDGTWERTPEQWRFKELKEYLKSLHPNILVNSRIGAYGDYQTPEQGVPIEPPKGPWELCMTLSDSWGYNPNDKNQKSLRQLIRIFTECIGMGGNLLLGIGPREDGTFDESQEKALLELGEWINLYQEAIYDTKRGMPLGHFHGSSTLSQDGKTLYLFLYDIPVDEICIKGIKNEVVKVTAPGTGGMLKFRRIGGFLEVPGILWIEVPKEVVDQRTTVIKVELADSLLLYRGKGEAIQA